MRTINLELINLDNVLENRRYVNKKGEVKKLLTNVNYVFSAPGVNFSCELYVDSFGELGITKINGNGTNANYECFYTLEDLFEGEQRNLYYSLMNDFGFLPSYRPFNEDCDQLFIGADKIEHIVESNKEEYSAIFYINENLYLANQTEAGNKDQFPEGSYTDEPYYDKLKVIEKKDILDIDYFLINDTYHISIYTNKGLVTMYINEFEAEEVFLLISSIKQNTLAKAA